MVQGVAFCDGNYVPVGEAKISILDPAFTRSDVVYDTATVWKGQFFRLDDHVARFFRSCEGARLTPPYGADEIKTILAECTHRAGLEDAYVQFVCTRGPFEDLTNRDPRKCKNGFFAYAIPYIWIISREKQDAGARIAIAANRRIPDAAINQRIKNFNWMDLSQGLIEAFDRGFDHVVLLTVDGRLAEGPGFNVWLVKDGKLRTPKDNCLHGLTRRTVLDFASELNIPAEETDLTMDDVRNADEAFLSTEGGGIMPVGQIEDKIYGNGGPGMLTSRLRTEYWRRREAGWKGTPVASLLKSAVPA
ncbi:MAG: aminotransferase class IV [Alphaproteobacteria bacterium]